MSAAVRLALLSFISKSEEDEIPDPEGSCSYNYKGSPGRRVTVVLDPEVDMTIRKAAARWRKSINAFYALAIQAWVVSEAAALTALPTPPVP